MSNKIMFSVVGVLALAIAALGFQTPITVNAGGPPDWDRSSLSIDGDCVDGVATFTVTNGGDGDMEGSTTYSYSIQGDGSGTGTVPALESGESFTFSISAPAGAKVTVTVYQRPGHPGSGQASADATCDGGPTPTSHTVSYGQTLSCDGWSAWYQIDDGSQVQYNFGGWTDGKATVPAFTIPTIPGDLYNITQIPSLDLDQPEGCNPVSHTVTYGQDPDCDGWFAWYQIDDGSQVQYASGGWTDGAATVPGFNIPTIPGDLYNITQIPAVSLTQPESCTNPVDHTVSYGQTLSCDGWSVWYRIDDGDQVQYNFGGWTDGAATVPAFSFQTNPGETYNITQIPAVSLTQPEGCNPPPPPTTYNHKLKVESTCTGYLVTPVSDDGGVFTPSQDSAPLSGLWVNPNQLESQTIKGTWTWPDGETVTETVTVRENTNCQQPKRNWKPTCPKCELKDSKNIVSWPTDRGDAGWKTRKLEGTMTPGVSVSVVVDDCTTDKRARCLLTQYVVVQYNATALNGKKIQFIDHGQDWDLGKPHKGVDGNDWVLYVGRVCNWLDKDETQCHSSNDWFVYIDGVLQQPYVYPGPNNLLYPYWLCSLPPSYAMTHQASDGKWEIEWLPGMDTWGGTIFYLKYTDVWPLGWPEDITRHSWIWKLPPLSVAREWANNYRLAGQFNFYKMPNK